MPESIVVGTDGSETAKLAVDEAIRIAKALGAELHVVSAYKPLKTSTVRTSPEMTQEGWQLMPDSLVDATLDETGATVKARGVGVGTHAVRRAPVDALLEVADKVQATMIVVGSQGMHGAKRLSLNNVPNQISHKARCNVLIVNTDLPDDSAAG
jgi:nucleotide-binding universal stress UspA family protein